MAPRNKSKEGKSEEKSKSPKSLPITRLTGINAAQSALMTVMVTALVETTGQVRFGDGTDIDTTITEKDTVVMPNGDSIIKYVWAGTKRRGVDRRIIHELRNAHQEKFIGCYIGNLCGQCPICWLYGFTGTTGSKDSPVKDINAKSRILYATSLSVEGLGQFPANRHARNAVDERTQKTGTATSGESGIHREEFIPEGVHFPIYTAAVRVLPWEFGAFAHGLLESLNSNRYSAGSRAMGGMKITYVNDWKGPALIVDVSSDGVFPLSAPKIASSELDFNKALISLMGMVKEDDIKTTLVAMGFTIEDDPAKNEKKEEISPDLAQRKAEEEKKSTNKQIKTIIVKNSDNEIFRLDLLRGALAIKCGNTTVMTRYWGEAARGYLESQRLKFRDYLSNPGTSEFWTDAEQYVNAIRGKTSETTPNAEENKDESETITTE